MVFYLTGFKYYPNKIISIVKVFRQVLHVVFRYTLFIHHKAWVTNCHLG